MPHHDSTHIREPDAGAIELRCAVQALEDAKQFVGVRHVESHAVIAHEKLTFLRRQSFARADGDARRR